MVTAALDYFDKFEFHCKTEKVQYLSEFSANGYGKKGSESDLVISNAKTQRDSIR